MGLLFVRSSFSICYFYFFSISLFIFQEKVSILLAQIDELKKNMPKKMLKKMEAQAKLAEEQELAGLGGGDRGKKKGACVIC